MLSPDVLNIDMAVEATRICDVLREQVLGNLRRKGIVVGVSGGIDSAVVAALATRALGSDLERAAIEHLVKPTGRRR